VRGGGGRSLALLCLLAAGCAPPTAPVPTGTPGTPLVLTATPARLTPSPTAVRTFSIGLALPDLATEPWRSLAYGVRDETAQRSVELVLPEAGGSGPERQARGIRELLGRRPDLLLVGGGGSPAVTAAVDEAARSLPIGGLTSLLPVERLVFKVGPDRLGLGRVEAECLGASLNGRGAVALIMGPPESVPAFEQSQGFREALQRQYPSTQIVAERAVALERAAAAGQVAEWLEQWPALAGVASGSNEQALGALDALWRGGRLGQTKVASIGLNPLLEPSLRDGGLQCAALQQAAAEGRAAVRNALAYLAQQPFERNVKSPPLLVTGDNLNKIDWSQVRAPG
jgi:ABC-type sugar transport system substrate-binding protein